MSTVNDKRWGELNAQLLVAMKAGDFAAMGSLYGELARIMRKERKDARHLIEESMRCSLQLMKAAGIVWARVLTSRDELVCPSCKALEGVEFKVADSIERPPIPMLCTANIPKVGNPWCRCTIVARRELLI